LPGQTPTVIRVIPQGTPDVVVDGVVRFSNPKGPVSLPDGTYIVIPARRMGRVAGHWSIAAIR
jgi:hypothetical protein